MTKKFKFSSLYLVAVFIVMYLPIAYLIYYSFNAGGDMTEFTGFTLEHYASLFSDQRLMTIVLDTFIVALLSALIATIIGTFGAILIFFTRQYGRKQVLLNLNNILMVTPDVMIGASFLILFTTILPVKLGFWTVLLSHVAFSIPIVVLMVLPQLAELNQNMIIAAEDLGASPIQILTRILLPNLTRGIISGFFMAFTYSLDDFAVTFFVTGNGFSTIAVEVYSRARTGISLEINALSTLMFIISIFLVWGYYMIQVKEKDENESNNQRGGN